MSALPLVLLPGTLCDARVWREQVEAFQQKRTVLVCELGNQPSLTDEVASYLNSLPPRFLLAGFSLGGIAAFEFYRQARARIAGLALFATNARPDQDASRQSRRALVERAQAGQMDTILNDVLLPQYFSPESEGREALSALVVSMAHSTSDRFAHQCRYASERPDSRPLLGTIDVPVLLVHGADDRVTPLDRHTELSDGMAGATTCTIPRCGHFVTLEAPADCIGAMAGWISQVTR